MNAENDLLYVIAHIGDERMLMRRSDVLPTIDKNADAMLWSPQRGYSDWKWLQVWFKWLYYVEEVEPYPWNGPEYE